MLNRALVILLMLIPSVVAVGATPDFDRDVAPLLVERCLDCHSGTEPKGKLDLSRRAGAMKGGEDGVVIVAGTADDSPMWDLVSRGKMPPKKPLAAAEREVIRAWIAGGARWGSDPIDAFSRTSSRRAGVDWWSLRPVAKVELPAVKNGEWGRNGIDAFVLAKLEERGLSPSPEAERRLLIRRVSFDLTGLPPSPAEVEAFVSDQSPNAYEKVVERLLASPQYGVRWARHWLDVARFGESNGFEYDEFRPDAWPYRDWVVEALNRDLPYDDFARLQIAGDVMRPGDAAAVAATGFLVAGAYDTPGQKQQSAAMRRVVREDELEDITGTLGQAFLGLTVQCARCHDHKFDPIRQREYYQLTAALAGVRHGVRELPLEKGEVERAKASLAAATKRLEGIEGPARARVLSARKVKPAKAADVPAPIASWDFRQSLYNRVGGEMNVKINGKASRTAEGLVIPAKEGHAIAHLTRDLDAKTLEAWVKLDKLEQGGGGVIGVEKYGGELFDAIVFGEREAGRWMAGSDFYNRYQSAGGPAETEAARRFVHVAVTYGADGVVSMYRDGKPYGRPYKAGTQAFKAGKSAITFGLRHSPEGGNKNLSGVIQRAAVYDRALTPAEVAASAGVASDFVSGEEIAGALTPEFRVEREGVLATVDRERRLLSGGRGKAYACVPREPEKVFLLTRGNPAMPAAEVAAGGVAAVSGVSADFAVAVDAPDARRRVALANWVASPKNPLFARVIVNRLWHYHFGAGIVETPNDFGFNGGRPSHPELLDWLANELVAKRFSLKAMHRLMVTSAAYRQSSRPNERAMAIDAGNRLVWRRSPLRMEAETVRDAVLAVAGQLDLSLGGPGYREFKTAAAPGTPAVVYTPLDPGDAMARRTLYRAWARGGRNGLLDVLDCPDPSATAPARAVTNTPLQALAMLNNAMVLRAAERSAKRLEREAQGVEGRVGLAYRLAYGRTATAEEMAAARGVVEGHGLATLARAIFNSNEFLFVE